MLDERPNAFDERNLFLHGLLGLVSASDKLHAILDSENQQETQGEPITQDDPFLLAVLGFVAFRQRLLETMSTIEGPQDEMSRGMDERNRPSVRSLLR